MSFPSRRFFSVFLCAGLVALAGCAADAPQRVDAAKPKHPLAQTEKGVGSGRIEAVRGVSVETSKERVTAPEEFRQTLARRSSPNSAGVELLVRLDNGESVKVVQTAEVAFRSGDRVRVVPGRDGSLRVTY
ncbi:MAG: hypothetical protein AB1717_05830 [Pseudomonadota bacterium]